MVLQVNNSMWQESSVEFSGIHSWLAVVAVERHANVVFLSYLVLQLNTFSLTYFAESDTMTQVEASMLTSNLPSPAWL